MIEVTVIENGFFRVKMTDMHLDCLDKACGSTGAGEAAILAMFIGAGMVEVGGFSQDPKSGSPPPKSLDPGSEAFMR